MKKIILVASLITICMGSYAQTDTTHRKEVGKTYPVGDKKNDGCAVRMEGGKVVMVIDGKTAILDKEMTLKDGTVVMTDGKLKMKEGKVVQLNEGDCVDNSGKIIVVKNNQIRKGPDTKEKK